MGKAVYRHLARLGTVRHTIVPLLWYHAVMGALLDLNPDQLLSTTRAVRTRLDFERPVDDVLVRECVAAAMQAPSGSNAITMQFVVVSDPQKRSAIGEIYRQCYARYRTWDGVYAGSIRKGTADEQQQQARVAKSADYLGEHLGDAPKLIIACNEGRVDGVAGAIAVASLSNVLPAMWSFMLAARARGLGTSWTTVHLMKEREVAEILEIPFDSVQQVCLSPLAHSVGTDFKPAIRPDADSIIHWNRW